jgi:hypothetical protein
MPQLALEASVAITVVAAALLNPVHATVGVVRLVGVVLVEAGVQARRLPQRPAWNGQRRAVYLIELQKSPLALDQPDNQ